MSMVKEFKVCFERFCLLHIPSANVSKQMVIFLSMFIVYCGFFMTKVGGLFLMMYLIKKGGSPLLYEKFETLCFNIGLFFTFISSLMFLSLHSALSFWKEMSDIGYLSRPCPDEDSKALEEKGFSNITLNQGIYVLSLSGLFGALFLYFVDYLSLRASLALSLIVLILIYKILLKSRFEKTLKNDDAKLFKYGFFKKLSLPLKHVIIFLFFSSTVVLVFSLVICPSLCVLALLVKSLSPLNNETSIYICFAVVFLLATILTSSAFGKLYAKNKWGILIAAFIGTVFLVLVAIIGGQLDEFLVENSLKAFGISKTEPALEEKAVFKKTFID